METDLEFRKFGKKSDNSDKFGTFIDYIYRFP